MSTRLNLSMSHREMIMAMCDGNPGSITVMVELLELNASIDPDSFLTDIGAICQLDELGIYGSNIWLAYKDVCGQDIPKLIALLRANQLGFISASDLKEYVVNARSFQPKLDVNELYKLVRAELPNFNK